MPDHAAGGMLPPPAVRLVLAVAALALAATPAAAQNVDAKVDRGNGMFFNRPGATLDQALADTAACRAIADGAQSQISGAAMAGAGIGGGPAGMLGALLGGAIAGGRQKRINIEHCMLVRGWRLFAMTREEGAAWKALDEAARKAQLEVMTGAAAPARGTLLRAWRNDYAEPVLWQE